MASIDFLPKRINDAPVVFRGMTLREVCIMAVTGFVSGMLPGIVLAILFGMPAMAPTVAVAVMALALVAGGTVMRRLRRGRPPSLLYRQILYRLAVYGINTGGETLITRSSTYRVGREPRDRGELR
ncbi:MAG: TIGR03750 family conjugal transfer protein [Pseudomonadota bacterium]|jgi:conjugative transfer region protein (TIGR03750 family)|uniref:TIGR03750 family conjugal transfer protein n=1 Tax=Salinicola sp. TaxID=1978524 RepID=UPI001D6168A1|nr:TIGR03750 family conjugal transfer protein [Salinicola sp.]MEC8916318.1 TIGR03750 family conjugal transfer protein [Pseudomonadota bacterium]MED5500202.1 TIGR03750 family conjugal transfer protein [Pseudomonadota bacterium]NRB56896.1 TIGR03750 family conjugal transfer protein [Salinicola sp.]